MEFTRTGDHFSADYELDNLIRFIYGLSALEYEIFEQMFVLREADSEYIMKRVGRKSKGMVNKALKKLIEEGLLVRKKTSVEGRTGFHFVYQSLSLEQVRQQVSTRVEKWYKRTNEKLDQLEDFFKKKLAPHPIGEETSRE